MPLRRASPETSRLCCGLLSLSPKALRSFAAARSLVRWPSETRAWKDVPLGGFSPSQMHLPDLGMSKIFGSFSKQVCSAGTLDHWPLHLATEPARLCQGGEALACFSRHTFGSGLAHPWARGSSTTHLASPPIRHRRKAKTCPVHYSKRLNGGGNFCFTRSRWRDRGVPTLT